MTLLAALASDATLEWVDWFNNRRLLDPIRTLITGQPPPARASP